MNARMANLNDVDKLIQVRFDYFSAEKWEVTNEIRDKIYSQLQQYYSKHLNIDFFAAFMGDTIEKNISDAKERVSITKVLLRILLSRA